MAVPLGVPAVPLLHVSGPIDPTLWAWLSDKIDHVLGISPGVMVLILGTFIVLFPVVVMIVALHKRRAMGR
jgi:hypothetical protein